LRAAPLGLLLFGGASNFGVGFLARAGLNLLWPLAYGGLMIAAMLARLRGVRL